MENSLGSVSTHAAHAVKERERESEHGRARASVLHGHGAGPGHVLRVPKASPAVGSDSLRT